MAPGLSPLSWLFFHAHRSGLLRQTFKIAYAGIVNGIPD
jgi:hypothetical protein